MAVFLARGDPSNEHVRCLLPLTINTAWQDTSDQISTLQLNAVDLLVRK